MSVIWIDELMNKYSSLSEDYNAIYDYGVNELNIFILSF